MIKIFDGYTMVEAVPAVEGHVLVHGSSYFKVMPEFRVWRIGQGNTGWYRCDNAGKPMEDAVYSVPSNSCMLSDDWNFFEQSIWKR